MNLRATTAAVVSIVAIYLSFNNSCLGNAFPLPIELQRTIVDPEPALERDFGWSVAAFNNDLLIGSYGGKVHRYDPRTGVEKLRIQSPETFAFLGAFGRSVTQANDKIVVGAPELDVGSEVRVGSAYIFDGTTGAHLKTLRNPTPTDFGWFGFSSASVGSKLFLSSESVSTGTDGKVHVYDANSGLLQNTIASPQLNLQGAYGFGFDLKEHGDDLFISSIGAKFSSKSSGAVYRFDASTLQLEKAIASPVAQDKAQFGHSIDSFGDYLLVGAPGVVRSGQYSTGEAYLFNASTGALLRTLTNPNPEFYSQFGSSVALLGNYAIVAAPRYKAGTAVGAAYVFDVSTGAMLGVIANPTLDDGGFAGSTDGSVLAAVGNQLAVGHFSSTRNGSVHLFSIPEPAAFPLALMTLCIAVYANSRIGRSN